MSCEDWKEVRLGNYITTLKGYAFKSSWYQKNGVPIIRVSNFTDNSVSVDNIEFIDEQLASNFYKYKLKDKDIIIQTVGSWQHNPTSIVGKVIRIPQYLENSLLNQNAVKVIPKDKIDNDFMYYRLKTEDFKFHNLAYAQGSANQASITLDSIKNFKFKLPPLKTQKKIAKILSNYDDLIENNLKQIKLLEEKARLTYEEWFLRFRVDGVELEIDSESGLPFGWEDKKIESICSITGGGTPSTTKKEYWDKGNIAWFSPTDLSKSNSFCLLDSNKKINDLGLKKSSAKLLKPNSFMMTSRATIGLFGIIEKSFSTNQGFINITPNRIEDKEYLLFNFKSRINEFKGLATGSTFPELSRGKFKVLKIVMPSLELRDKFHNEITLLIKKIFNIQHQNQNLKEVRDILLPRLMTGVIEP